MLQKRKEKVDGVTRDAVRWLTPKLRSFDAEADRERERSMIFQRTAAEASSAGSFVGKRRGDGMGRDGIATGDRG